MGVGVVGRFKEKGKRILSGVWEICLRMGSKRELWFLGYGYVESRLGVGFLTGI